MPIDILPALGTRELSREEAELLLDSTEVCDVTSLQEAQSTMNKMDSHQIDSIILSLRKSLDNDFPNTTNGNIYYSPLRLLRSVLAHQDTLDSQFFILFELASYHSNPHVSWGDETNSLIANDLFLHNQLIRQRAQSCMPDFIANSIRPNLLKVSASPQTLRSGGLLQNDQVLRLGITGPKRDIEDENARKDWKQSSKIKVLSMTWLGLILLEKAEWHDAFAMLVISLILNVGDDYLSSMKLQACNLLQLLLDRLVKSPHAINILLRLGLHSLLLDFCKTCAHQIPSVTPVKDSVALLSVAYPCMLQLVSLMEKNPVFEYTAIINNNILSSISHLNHLSPRTSPETSNYRVMCLLIDQLSALIQHHLHLGVLVSLSRILFTLNQIIINPFIVEDASYGQILIISCLQCQRTILHVFNKNGDKDAALLMANYRYDLVGAWIVIFKRLEQVRPEHSKCIQETLGQSKSALEGILSRCDQVTKFKKDLATKPDLSQLYSSI